jgi:hypothetical protein
MILRFESLEGRALLTSVSTTASLPDLVAAAFSTTPSSADYNQTIEAKGAILNNGTSPVPPGALVAIYASPTNIIGPGSVLVGQIAITTGLKAGATQTFDQQITLPPSPLPGMGSTAKTLYLGLRIDPGSTVAELNKGNNEGVGLGVDQVALTLTPTQPSSLVGTSFGISATTTTWGSELVLTAQVMNRAQGDAPATRAKVVLTPNGLTPGSTNDVTIGSINIPAVPAFQTVNVQTAITLPATKPGILDSSGAYLISLIQDADHQASPIVQNATIQGLGLDTQVIQIGKNTSDTAVPQGPTSDLAATGVITPNTAIYWGQSFQVTTSVQNLGQGAAGTFQVQFLLTGTDGNVNRSLYLGSAEVAGLKAGYTQQVIQNLQLPSRLPYGYDMRSATIGRIVALVDPEYQINEASKTNNVGRSAPISLRLLGSDGTTSVPTAPPIKTAQPPSTITPATVTHPVVPVKTPHFKRPVKHKTDYVKAVVNYPQTIVKFLGNLISPSKPKPRTTRKKK